jgi:hypothetical protein
LSEVERLPEWLVYATVHKVRENNHVVKGAALVWTVLGCVSTVFIERSNGTDRHRNSRKVRKTYRFSKDWEVHRAMTIFTMYSANVCGAVRTLQVGNRKETPPGTAPVCIMEVVPYRLVEMV